MENNALDLPSLVSRTVKKYVASSFDATLIYGEDTEAGIYFVNVIPDDYTEEPHIMITARIIGDYVVVITDTTDRPLEDYLEEAGIPRSQIKVAWQGERLPESAPAIVKAR
jgi:hypothetical protein